MNEMNQSETQLRSWTPRRPSAGLERRLFGRPAKARRPAVFWGWLAPAAACLLFVCAALKQQGTTTLADPRRQGPMLAAILSNQSDAAYLPGSFRSRHYNLDTFEWTNGGSSTSSISFTPFTKPTD